MKFKIYLILILLLLCLGEINSINYYIDGTIPDPGIDIIEKVINDFRMYERDFKRVYNIFETDLFFSFRNITNTTKGLYIVEKYLIAKKSNIYYSTEVTWIFSNNIIHNFQYYLFGGYYFENAVKKSMEEFTGIKIYNKE